eukprot:11244111-Karenia_brevis.AAC.1
MYGGLQRRFRTAGGLGQAFVSTNGVLQGCPLSVVLLNALVAVWAKAVQSKVPTSQPEAFADDTQVLTKTRRDVSLVAETTQDFARRSGQTLSVKKSYAFTT